jgi:hypothetical protein
VWAIIGQTRSLNRTRDTAALHELAGTGRKLRGARREAGPIGLPTCNGFEIMIRRIANVPGGGCKLTCLTETDSFLI